MHGCRTGAAFADHDMRNNEQETTAVRPRVSVAMTTYNGARYVREQVESILACLAPEDELVISDDGSTDDTLSVLREISESDARVKVIKGPGQGVVRNFECALDACRGEYLFLSDQDDRWHPDKVTEVLRCFEETGAQLVLHNAAIYNQTKGEVVGTMKERLGYTDGYFKNVLKHRFTGCCMAMTSELKGRVLPFPSQKEIMMHDWWIALVAIRTGKVSYIEKPLIDYRIHENNVVGLKKDSFLKRISTRVRMLRAMRKYKKQYKK